MKKLIALILTLLFSCQQERIDFPKSVVEGGWDSEIGSLWFDRGVFCEVFHSACKYYIAERTIVISLHNGEIMRLTIKQYDTKQIICDMDYLGEDKQITLIKTN